MCLCRPRTHENTYLWLNSVFMCKILNRWKPNWKFHFSLFHQCYFHSRGSCLIPVQDRHITIPVKPYSATGVKLRMKLSWAKLMMVGWTMLLIPMYGSSRIQTMIDAGPAPHITSCYTHSEACVCLTWMAEWWTACHYWRCTLVEMEPEDLARIYSNVLETVCKESPVLLW